MRAPHLARGVTLLPVAHEHEAVVWAGAPGQRAGLAAALRHWGPSACWIPEDAAAEQWGAGCWGTANHGGLSQGTGAVGAHSTAAGLVLWGSLGRIFARDQLEDSLSQRAPTLQCWQRSGWPAC